MKIIRKIALTELQTLFYSPVAWLILIVFAFQCSMVFTDSLAGLLKTQDMGYRIDMVTQSVFNGHRGVFPNVIQYLYLYIPLLTMGLMSRELGSGSIKLLYSSPVKNTQIILGKYLAVMVYGLVMIAIVAVYVVWGIIVIDQAEVASLLSGLLGVYLVICVYGAIGLFMSSVTSYQVVAAMGTLAILAVLNYLPRVGQNIDFVREITYWLGIGMRSQSFLGGLISSEDLIYYILLILLFLSLSILRLQARRQKSGWKVSLGKYTGVVILALLCGYITSRPQFKAYYDTSPTKYNTLTPNSQQIVKQLKGGLNMTTYVNLLDMNFFQFGLPNNRINDKRRFEHFIRFKPEIKMDYVYYYYNTGDGRIEKFNPGMSDREIMVKTCKIHDLDTNMFLRPEEIDQLIDLKTEEYRMVRVLERESGEKTFLRMFPDFFTYPSESEISAALKRISSRLPVVGFLKGHGAREMASEGERDYSTFTTNRPYRYSLLNQGFDFEEVGLEKEIPDHIDILVVADLRTPLNEEEMTTISRFIDQGGNLFILGESRRQEVMNPLLATLGVSLMPGQIVRPNPMFTPDLIYSLPTEESKQLSGYFREIGPDMVMTLPGAAALSYEAVAGYNYLPVLTTDSAFCWTEQETRNFVDDTVRYNPETGEIAGPFTTALALTRKTQGKEQKIMIVGDADCISNGELGNSRQGIRSANFNLIRGTFHWLADHVVPVDVSRPPFPDHKLNITGSGEQFSKIILRWIFPALLIACCLLIWLRRRGR